MTAYLLHDDNYEKGNFDLTLAAVGSGTTVTAFPEASNITDPREFNSTKINWGSDTVNPLPYRNLDFIFTLNKTRAIDYVAFNKHNFNLVHPTIGALYIAQIQIIKWVQPATYTSLDVHVIPQGGDNKNIVMKFDYNEFQPGESVIVRFKLNGFARSQGGKQYGSSSIKCSYVQIGQSTELSHLKAPLNIPIDSVYETKNLKSDTGLVIGTSSKEQPIPIDLNLVNMNYTFITQIINMTKDLPKNPFFIYDDSGTLPNIPFCWVTKKMTSPKLNTNHLYDLRIKAQGKVYE